MSFNKAVPVQDLYVTILIILSLEVKRHIPRRNAPLEINMATHQKA
jgi:hypothetical protein